MEARQLLAGVTTTAAQPTVSPLVGRSCGGLNLPVGGVLSMPNGDLVTLTAAAAFKPVCTPVAPPAIIANGGGGSVAIDESAEGSMPTDDGWTYSDFRDPFYASTFPQCYALAATTVVAYTLVIILFITPRSFLDGGVVVLGRRGFTNGGTGPTIGGRPWLQKIAALSVAISLTIASAATFDAAEEQYSFGVQNARRLQMEVLGGNELKIIRIISQTFLWLAQAQTLIRLFPRQREKNIIKWVAFALITLDAIFQSLNSFLYTDQGVTRPGAFQDAVPALNYLFTLTLGVLYAAWVIYYALTKKRYAFLHPQMKNMCLVAGLSMLAILIPIVFFILDICKPDFTGWGEYVRWVGAAAASVIVWEWVERIEALEREEKKDGILGREVFDGDEMLEMTPLDHRLRRRRKGSGDDGEKGISVEGRKAECSSTAQSNKWPTVTSFKAKYRSRSKSRKPAKPADPTNTASSNHDRIRFLQPPLWPARPAPAVTPVSRTDTASAASTVYAVRYHPLTETTSRTTPPPVQNSVALSRGNSMDSSHASDDGSPSEGGEDVPPQRTRAIPPAQNSTASSSHWHTLMQRLPRQGTRRHDEERAVPPAARESVTKQTSSNNSSGKWDIRGRLEEFAATQAERLREKFRTTPDTDSLPVTVIPAPPRPGAALAQLLEEEDSEAAERQQQQVRPVAAGRHGRSQQQSCADCVWSNGFFDFGC
ncbi:pH-response regulator protein palH/prr-4 [Achaetomium macrosporum]|uniref:PH-response regulator protein palH/prr-4 n=1 Tax=Achaetomium macrosporum TaxID=79813 RepID=A0AAN7C289_9PEZI|nr:pH-response regulator protein palH/prr-4 [Achaetomium macrosporum]